MMSKTDPGDVPCNGCTLCCRDHHLVLLFPEYGDDVASYETQMIGGAHALKMKENGDCIYLGEGGCSIHERVPGVCREFDCRALFATSSRAERRAMGDGERAVYKAGRQRVETLNQEHPIIVDIKERRRKGESFLSRTGVLKTMLGPPKER
jgi:Fe-S-cluster containining protein